MPCAVSIFFLISYNNPEERRWASSRGLYFLVSGPIAWAKDGRFELRATISAVKVESAFWRANFVELRDVDSGRQARWERVLCQGGGGMGGLAGGRWGTEVKKV